MRYYKVRWTDSNGVIEQGSTSGYNKHHAFAKLITNRDYRANLFKAFGYKLFTKRHKLIEWTEVEVNE